jgi:hypothetical protein
MAIGRITGPLLASNLTRDGVNLTVDTTLFQFDVQSKRIGILTLNPTVALDVHGDIKGYYLTVNTATIGLVSISSNTVTNNSFMTTSVGPLTIQPGSSSTVTIIADTTITGSLHVTGNITADGDIILGDTTSSDRVIFESEIASNFLPWLSTGTYSVTTGTGTGTTATIFTTNTSVVSAYSLGSTSNVWLGAYFNTLFANTLDTLSTVSNSTSTSTVLQVFPDIPKLERSINKTLQVNGDIRVYGTNPLGTAPVVSNVLYVTMDGDDTNDGRAMDSTRACRTVSGATKSPYYQEGTIIKVLSGHYMEDNPIEMLPYTSVVGDDLRTTFLEPINKDTDLFHVNSGVYIAQMAFLNLRRGKVTRYAPGGAGTYTTGAYCVAFPPRLDNPISLYHSPYIQNCTNQSGPWLYDKTMFIPNNTVQVPLVVADSTYGANTSSLAIKVNAELSSQQIKVGMAVNGSGFIADPNIPVAVITTITNANTSYQHANKLISDNGVFLKSEIVNYINWKYPDLVYNTTLCERDTGYVIDAFNNDIVYGGNANIVYAGQQYFINNSNLLGAELSPTVDAYQYLAQCLKNVVTNTPISVTTGNILAQTFNISLSGGEATTDTIDNLSSLLSDILLNEQGYSNAGALLNANRGFIQSETVGFVNKNYVGQPTTSFTYNKPNFFNNIGLALDALKTDLSYGGNQQTINAGLQYWVGTSATLTSTISGEVSQTVAAYEYLSQVLKNVVTNTRITDGYCFTLTQYIGTINTGTVAAAELISRNLDILTDIIAKGPDAAPTLFNNGASVSTIDGIVNSLDLININSNWIKHELVSYVDTTFTQQNFTYNSTSCSRDTGLIIDSISMDLLYGSSSNSTFAALQYWNQSNTADSIIPGELTTTTQAFAHARDICFDIAQNNYINALQTNSRQVYSTATGSLIGATAIQGNWQTVINILSTGSSWVTNAIQPNGSVTTDRGTLNAYNLVVSNKQFIIDETIEWVRQNSAPGFTFDETLCRRDTGYVINSVLIDTLRGGNRQSIQAGTYYYNYIGTSTVLVNEIPQTTAAYKYLKYISELIVQNRTDGTRYQTDILQVTNLPAATASEAKIIVDKIGIINDIIKNGPVGANKTSLPLTYSTDANTVNAYNLLVANKEYIKAETIAFVETTFIDPYSFTYNEQLCFRDMGLIVDSIVTDISNHSNQRSIYAGIQYWDGAVSVINGQLKETAGAVQFAKEVALRVIANRPIIESFQTSTNTASIVTQTINPLLTDGYVAASLVSGNFDAVATIIENGPDFAPQATDENVTEFIITLSTTTNSSSTNDTLYIGETTVYPIEDKNISSTWGKDGEADRRIDPHGSGGGALVDGNAPSTNSPIQSFVFDAFTQITQGGPGVHIINNGYAQLVSVFTIFCDVGVHVESGGIASIVNSNANFGDICLLAEGYGKRQFGGTVYNPSNIEYNELSNSFVANTNYPEGFFPNNANVCIFVPSPDNRPHISLVMEVVPPDQYIDFNGNQVPYINSQGFPGFLTAASNTATLFVGTYEISGIDVTDMAIGQNVYIRDQYGSQTDSTGTYYISTDTTIVAMSYQTITLSKPITATGSQAGNLNYFNIYTCGNAYYSVVSSKIAGSPYPIGQSKIKGQENETIDAINYMSSVCQSVISNTVLTTTYNTSTVLQVTNGAYSNGAGSVSFVANELDIVTGVILKGPQNAPASTATDIKPAGNLDAIQLLKDNKIFIMNETVAYVDAIYPNFTYDQTKCFRDTGLIVDSIAMDLLYGGTSQSTFSGLQYWKQSTSTETIIPGELTTTTSAISYARTLAINATNGYGATSSRVGAAFDNITTILSNGVGNITNTIVPNGLASTNASIINGYNALIASTSTIISDTINFINTNNPGFVYDQTRCRKDLHYILESVAFDTLHGGNRQSIQSGAYYYQFSSSSSIPKEIPQTTSAYNFIKGIIGDIITGTPISPSYQNTVTQVTNLVPGVNSQISLAQGLVDVMTHIIQYGPAVVSGDSKVPIGQTMSTDPNVLNAYNLIIANRSFIQNETIAYVNKTYKGFTYNKFKCRRDVGLIIDALIYDLQTGGNSRAVEAAVTYYTKDGTYHIVSLEDQVRDPTLFVDGTTVNFYQRSYMSASGYVFEYVGAGTQYGALPQVGRVDPNQSKETVQLNNGKVFFTSTDQNGDFRIGPGLVISQATGVITGRTFTKSLFSQLTPFILVVGADIA